MSDGDGKLAEMSVVSERRAQLARLRTTSAGEDHTLDLQFDLRWMKQGVVDEAVMNCVFHAVLLLLGEFDGDIHLDEEVFHASGVLNFLRGNTNACSHIREL